ncbi:Imm1 family immunity protein [Micromonospora wenchangensis]|uniref:Imm1 family immunity protein n=1 Tax=Micromonospora wenchangensis TaxID=1185415 RepID=UPI0037F8255D
MKMTWTYDRGDQRANHEVELSDPDDPDDLPPSLQIGLSHPIHAFAVHISDDSGYLNDPAVEAPAAGIQFDFGGVPTEYPAGHLQLRPETAIHLAVAFLRTSGEPRSGEPVIAAVEDTR